jgi:hypothetical protein
MEKLSRDVLGHLVQVGYLTGKDLVSFSLVNSYINRSFLTNKYFTNQLKKEFEIYRLNKWNDRKLYVKMYIIRENYKTLNSRMEILNVTEEGIHDNRPVYIPTYLYELLYAKHTYDAYPFLSSIMKENVQMDIFYDNINIVMQNKLQYLTKEEYLEKYGSEKAYFSSLNERRKRHKTMDLENIWFDEIKPVSKNFSLAFQPESPYGGMWEHWDRYQGSNIDVHYIDSLWDNAANILRQEIIKVDRNLYPHFLEQNCKMNEHHSFYNSILAAHICTNYEKRIKSFSSIDYFHKKLLTKSKEARFRHDIYKLSQKEIGMIIFLHNLFMEGILSITMPLAFLK